WIAAAVLGPATLLKGPIALLLPALALPMHLFGARRAGFEARVRPWGPMLLAVALAVPWFGYAAGRHGLAFVWAFFGHHHLERFFTEKLGEGRGLFYYPSVYPGDTLPWSVVVPGALWIGARARALRAEPWRSAIVWTLVLFGFFTLSTGKREV